MSGARNHAFGVAAEQSVAAHYIGMGHRLLHHRWRGAGGEIDLIFSKDAEIVFVEVKASKTHDRAVSSLGAHQIARLLASAEDFLAGQPKGQLTPMRFDVAIVDGSGAIEVLANALCA